ncbi:valine--tRNA ligase [Halobacteriovorax sp. GB3]|uniref:valine--tRNA ligase n=1 Tax=Halobacteriovorax sp. GB3 TaxID=2719615 RepID=UPI00235DED48|nr:valine--tRNA ligase [Halobacteriovorax sp. GB3]MDD0852414.1 valine--tRNA ligase [Halobacteriovorax sp. GB3]
MSTENKNNELSTTYSPEDVEKKWYQKWEDEKYFAPKKGKQDEGFCIIMPPPNVTGKLHAGHALDITTQDALIRFKRMKGYETLFLPGMDHAGIATQSKVEEQVWNDHKKTKHDYTREEFLELIWKWKEEYGGTIAHQQRTMGASADWDYSMFTMDPEANEAVRKCFVSMYNEGLIYQSDYIVNWDPALQSAVSDAEVEHKEVQGAFYHIHYKVKDSDIVLEVATTRPETLLGDTAVAVNPEDDRFNHLIGKTAIVPICNREVPIIGDEHVDIEKGTGCLKVTPGHDFNDFEIGQRHKLEVINILNLDGTLNEKYGLEFAGLTSKKARKKVVDKLKELELFVKEEKHVHQVGHGDRSKAIIEPMVSKQWFVNVQDMAKTAVEAVENDTTRFYPKGWENTYFSWLREPKNWCVSRQLWWGHRIPVFTCKSCDHQWADEAIEPTGCPKCSEKNYTQDPDVLDTWFSSGLWPLSTLGWPDPERMKERKFDTFYPTSVLVTGFDIIFFWVARMMMMSYKMVDQKPFDKVYIHAIVRDKLGRKMSKSLGNGIDPIDMVNEYGADAFRFTLAAGSGYNRNINLDPDRIGGYRNFVNKIWNAFRFIQPSLDKAGIELPEELDHHERWILSELNETTKVMNESMDEFRYDDSCQAIYSFVYDKFCSWFIEISKNILNGDDEAKKEQRATVLRYTFRKIVALLHPVTPFITEELWGYLKEENEDLLIIQEYPEYSQDLIFTDDQDKMNKFVETVTAIRNLRSSVNIKPKEEVTVKLFTDEQELTSYFSSNTENFASLARVKELSVEQKDSERPKKSIMSATTHTEIFLPLEGVINLDEQIARLEKDLTKTQKEYDKYAKKINNEKFMSNAPDHVVVEVRENAALLEEKLTAIKENLENFKS